MTIRLRYRPPYDWLSMLSFLRLRSIPGIETVTGDVYARAIEAHLAKDPALAAMIRARLGLRVPGAWDGFELAVRALLGQQITVTAGIALAGKLVAVHGKPLKTRHPDFPELTHVFPRARRIAGADLSHLGMPQKRIAALASLAAAVAADPQIFGARRSLDEAIVQLRALAGIGEWTAQYIAMRELREPDAFPAADIGLMRAMEDSAGQRPGPEQLLARAEAWRPWRAYAAQHLWSSWADRALREHGSKQIARPKRLRKAGAELAAMS